MWLRAYMVSSLLYQGPRLIGLGSRLYRCQADEVNHRGP